MEQLTQMKCVPCNSGEPIASGEEIAHYQQQVHEWSLVDRDGIKRIERVFKFKNFVEALAFTNKVGELAEQEGHHPALLTEWGKVTVTWWTHAIKGLHKNDFIVAARTDQLYSS